MPLIQLSTLVFPAPFGPISANNSPASAASEMPPSTTRPPNRNFSDSISSSAIPPPTAAILLDGPIAPAIAAGRLSEIEFLDVAVRAQPRTVAVEYDLAIFKHIAVIGDAQRDRGTLFHDDDGDTEFMTDLRQAPDQLLHHDGREAERQFVDQQELRSTDQRAGERQHLPLAARQQPRGSRAQFRQTRKELVRDIFAVATIIPRGRKWGRQILDNRKVGKHLFALGHEGDAEAGDFVRLTVLDALAVECDAAIGHAGIVDAEKTRDRAQ